MTALAPTDKDILMALQEHGTEFLRLDILALAAAVGCEEEYARETIKRLEEDGTIEGYAAVVDAEELGYLTLLVDIACEFDLEDRIKRLKAFTNTADFSIVGAYVITGEKDIHLEVKVRGIEGYKVFVRTFPKVAPVGAACGTLGYQCISRDRTIELREP